MMWDAEASAAEVRRVAEKGCHAVSFSSNPYALGLPSLYSEHWDPFWAACVEEGTVSVHAHRLVVDRGRDVARRAGRVDLLAVADQPDRGRDRHGVEPDVPQVPGAAGRARPRGVSAGCPTSCERVDYIYDHTQHWSGMDLGGKLPSEVFDEHVILCFIDDAIGVENRHHLNIDNITWELRLPALRQRRGLNAPERVMEHFAGVSDAEIDKITHLNAMRHFQFDPFRLTSREESTVGALRRSASRLGRQHQARSRSCASSAGGASVQLNRQNAHENRGGSNGRGSGRRARRRGVDVGDGARSRARSSRSGAPTWSRSKDRPGIPSAGW